MNSPRPNLFLIGSMKSGTTLLSQVLAAHPAIFMSSPKEPCHFVDPNVLRHAWPWMWRQGYWRSEERYLSLFEAAQGAAVIAEASTVYAKLPMFSGVCARILAFSPRARFVYIMRDPVERAISHYWHRVRWWGERRSMLAALRHDPQYADVSHYARQLKGYLDYVGRDRIYALTLEQLRADPAVQMRQLYSWLGVDPSVPPPQLEPINVRPQMVEQARGFGLLDRVRKLSWYGRSAFLLPQKARDLAAMLAVRPVRPAEVSVLNACDFLRSRQIEQTEELSQLLQRTFFEWKTLYGHGAREVELTDEDTIPRWRARGG